MKNIFSVILILIFSTNICYTQNEYIIEAQKKAEQIGRNYPDSAFFYLELAEKRASPKELPSVKASNFCIKAWIMFRLEYYDSSRHFIDLAIVESTPLNDLKTLSKAYNLKGVLLQIDGHFEESLNASRKSLGYSSSISDSLSTAKTLSNMGNTYRFLGLLDSSLNSYQASISIVAKLDDELSLAKTMINLADHHFYVGKFHEAIEYYNQVKVIYQNQGYQDGLGILANNKGKSYAALGYNTLALKSYIEALNTYDQIKLEANKFITLMNISKILRKQQKYRDALAYSEQALSMAIKNGDLVRQANIYDLQGDILQETGDWLQSLEVFEKAMKIFGERKMLLNISKTYHGLARTYTSLHDSAEASHYLELSLNLKYEIGDSLNLGYVYMSKAALQFDMGQYDQALQNYQLGLDLAKKYSTPIQAKVSLLGLSKVCEAMNNPKKALKYRQQYELVKDSLDNVEKARQIAELKEQYESEQKDKRINELALENSLANTEIEKNEAIAERQKAIKATFIVAAIALAILILVLFVYFKQRLSLARLREEEEQAEHKRNIESLLEAQRSKNLEARIAGEEQERKRLAKDLHDHLGSILATVKVNLRGIFGREKSLQDNEQVQTVNTLVDKACNDVRGIAHNLHMGISETFGLTTALKDLAATVSGANGINVQFSAANCNQRFETNLEIFIYRLVQESLSNALRYSEANQISIQLTCLNDLISIIVEDNGKGFNQHSSSDHGKGIGLKNLIARIEAFDGEINIDSSPGNGTTILVDLPLITQPQMV